MVFEGVSTVVACHSCLHATHFFFLHLVKHLNGAQEDSLVVQAQQQKVDSGEHHLVSRVAHILPFLPTHRIRRVVVRCVVGCIVDRVVRRSQERCIVVPFFSCALPHVVRHSSRASQRNRRPVVESRGRDKKSRHSRHDVRRTSHRRHS